jgi:invasion protein IalB
MCRSRLVFSVLLSGLIFVSAHAQAGEPRLMGSYGDWEAYTFFEAGNKVCYMASQPKAKEGNYTKRGEPFVLITHRPADSTRNVFSYITGYSYKSGSEATATIDGKDYVLYTQDETAWGPDAETDKRLADAIKNGSKMSIKGVSSRGTKTTDTFSLKGSSKAYKRISDECRG